MFSSSRNRPSLQSDIDELKDDIVRIDRNINTLSDRIDDRARLRALREVNKDIRSLLDKIEKNKDFIFEAADCNNPGPDVNPVCSRIRQPEEEDDGEEEQVGGGKKRKSRKKRGKRKSRNMRKKRKTRNKKGGHHEAIVLGALALSKIFKNKKKKKKTRKKRRR
tara:strand:- start:1150 stop:1641 length:492 start_codon:yes stop_codon:yes gene_type:complete